MFTGTVGLTEPQAVKKYGKVKVFKSQFRPLKHTVNSLSPLTQLIVILQMTGSTERSLMKVLVDDASDRSNE